MGYDTGPKTPFKMFKKLGKKGEKGKDEAAAPGIASSKAAPMSKTAAPSSAKKVVKKKVMKTALTKEDVANYAKSYDLKNIKKEELIGRGGYGTVYRGTHMGTGEKLAIKEMPMDATSSECVVGSFVDELQMLTRLDHDRVVKLKGHEICREKEHAYLYLEYMSGGSLFGAIQQHKRLYEMFIRRTMRDAVEGILYLHSVGVIHRDIKPHNLLLDAQGRVKVADFGCCKDIQERFSATTRDIIGTPHYMAPDAINGRISKASDIWSVGASICHMAAGYAPWSTAGVMNNVRLIFHIGSGVGKDNHHPEVPPHLSPEAQRVVRLCFRHSPNERPTCEELLQTPFMSDVTVPLEGTETMESYSSGAYPVSSWGESSMWSPHNNMRGVGDMSTMMTGTTMSNSMGMMHHHHHHHHHQHQHHHHHHHQHQHHHHHHHHQHQHQRPGHVDGLIGSLDSIQTLSVGGTTMGTSDTMSNAPSSQVSTLVTDAKADSDASRGKDSALAESAKTAKSSEESSQPSGISEEQWANSFGGKKNRDDYCPVTRAKKKMQTLSAPLCGGADH